jgi:hypothetical protein
LLEYVSGELRGIGDKRAQFNLDDAALAVFALASAGKAEPAYHEQLSHGAQSFRSNRARCLPWP